MNYLKYNRSFVMMEGQTTDFSTREVPVKGYLKVETGNNKGALRCVVQNLKYYNRGEYIYKLIFFGKKKGTTIHAVLGNLIINRYGNGETYFRFDPLNLDGKGNRYDEFTIAIVAAASTLNDKEPLHPVLKGVTRTDSVRYDEASLEEPAEEKEENLTKVSGTNLEADTEVQIKHESDEEAKHEIKADRGIYNNYYNEYLLQFCNYTCRMAEYYQEVKPFDNDLTGAQWKRIQNVCSLPLVSPGAHYFADQYKHYLFGAKPDSKGYAVEYFFAIPGRYTGEEQPDGGRSGFVYWQPVTGATKEPSSYGYWIVAVDSKTGDIQEVEPIA